ncbi:MAG: chemotaxis protein CheB, partial [Chryseobacterium sp.]
IYIAPPDYHLLLEADGTISLDVSEKVNYCRPSIDVTFISAANAYKKGLTAILLSGANADGAAGMIAIHECEGKNIVQHPVESQVSYMPEQAIITGVVDEILSVTEIATFINHL